MRRSFQGIISSIYLKGWFRLTLDTHSVSNLLTPNDLKHDRLVLALIVDVLRETLQELGVFAFVDGAQR